MEATGTPTEKMVLMTITLHGHDIVAIIMIALIISLLSYTAYKYRIGIRDFFKHNDPPPKR